MDHVFNVLEQYASNLEEEVRKALKEIRTFQISGTSPNEGTHRGKEKERHLTLPDVTQVDLLL